MAQEDLDLAQRVTRVETELGHVKETMDDVKNAVTDGDTTILEQVKGINGTVQSLDTWRTKHVGEHELTEAKEEGRREVWVGVGNRLRMTVAILAGTIAALQVLLNFDAIRGLFP